MNSSIILPKKAPLIGERSCEGYSFAQAWQPSVTGLQSLCVRMPPVPFPVIAMTDNGPVQAGVVSNWPTVLPHQTCGEFKRKIHHGHASAS